MFLIRDVITRNGTFCSCCKQPLKKGDVVARDWMKYAGTYTYCMRCLKDGTMLYEVQRQIRGIIHNK